MGWWASLWYEETECPRVVMGYHCRGKGCDHSQDALGAAYKAVGKIYYRR